MNDQLRIPALREQLPHLDTSERVWVLGGAHIVGIDSDSDFSADEVREILDVCTSAAVFPTGPVHYLPDVHVQEELGAARVVTITADSAPHLLMHIGLGRGGAVGVAFTRSGRFDDGVEDASGVLLADIESVIADVYALSIAAALHRQLLGPIDMSFRVSPEGPGATPHYYCVDEDWHVDRLPGNRTPFAPLRHRFELTEDTTPESVHRDMAVFADRLAREVGAPRAQFVTLEQDFERDYEPELLGPVPKAAGAEDAGARSHRAGGR